MSNNRPAMRALKSQNVTRLLHAGEITSTGGAKVLAFAAQLLCHL